LGRGEIATHKELERLSGFSTSRIVKRIHDDGDFLVERGYLLGIIMESMGPNLLGALNLEIAFPLSSIRSITRDIFLALSFLHGHDFIHADIQPSNITMDEVCGFGGTEPRIKLVDMASSRRLREPTETFSEYGVQKPGYRSPEVLHGQPWGKGVDLWGAGVVVAQLVLGRPLIDPKHEMKSIQTVVGGSAAAVELKPSSKRIVNIAGRRSSLPSALSTVPTMNKTHLPPSIPPKARRHKRQSSLGALPLPGASYPHKLPASSGSAPPTRTMAAQQPSDGPGSLLRHTLDSGDILLKDLVLKTLNPDPKCRINAKEAASHPFVHGAAAESLPGKHRRTSSF